MLIVSDIMETPSLSVLQLELNDLKDSMSLVHSEVEKCLTSLNSQNCKVFDAVARLENVTAIVKAINVISAKQNPNMTCSTSKKLNSDNLGTINDTAVTNANLTNHYNHSVTHETKSVFPSASSHDTLKKEVEPMNIHSEVLEASGIRTNGELFPTSNNKYKGATSGNEFVAVKDNKDKVCIPVDACFDQLSTTRPSLKNRRKAIKNEPVDSEMATSSHSITEASITKSLTASPTPCSTSMSFPGSYSSCQATPSVKMSVNKVKELCKKHGWRLEGGHSTRAGKEGCPDVHFYEVTVKMSNKDEVVRGMGGNKNEAIKRAFKSMESKIKEADKKVENEKRDVKKGESDFSEDHFQPSEQGLDDSFHQLPVFHAQDCEEYYTSIQSHPGRVDKRQVTVHDVNDDEIVIKGLTISSKDARTIIGPEGGTIKNLKESTGVKISILGIFGDEERPVQIKGKANQVSLALEMIQEIIGVASLGNIV